MDELRFQVVVDKDLGPEVSGAVAFGDFESKESNATIYRSNEAQRFVCELILGRSFPFVFVTRDIDNLGTALAITIFLHRDLAIHPALPELLAAVSLVDELGVVGLAHIDRDLARFFRFVRAYTGSVKGKKAQQEALENTVQWFRSYLVAKELPGLPSEQELPRVIDQGTDGFVVATVAHPDMALGWEELFRLGFLRGVLFQSAGEDRWNVLAARKSAYLSFDLAKAAEILNEAEASMGEPRGWRSDGAWLRGPEEGTLLVPSAVIQVLLRV